MLKSKRESPSGSVGSERRSAAPREREDDTVPATSEPHDEFVQRALSPGPTRSPGAALRVMEHDPARAPLLVQQFQRTHGNQFVQRLLAPLQKAGRGGVRQEEIQQSAADGMHTPATALPHAERIQQAFGRHDTYTGRAGPAADAAHVSASSQFVQMMDEKGGDEEKHEAGVPTKKTLQDARSPEEESADLRSKLEEAHGDLDAKAEEITRIFGLVGRLPIKYMYLKNRWESHMPQWKSQLTPRANEKLSFLRSRWRKWKEDADFEPLLKTTAKIVKSTEPKLKDIQVQAEAVWRQLHKYEKAVKRNVDGKGKSKRSTGPVRYPKQINAIGKDPQATFPNDGLSTKSASGKEISVEKSKLIEIEDVFDEETKFSQSFGLGIAVVTEAYRSSEAPFKASDAFLSQWMSAMKQLGDDKEPPESFPSIVYINNVANVKTAPVMEKILGRKKNVTKTGVTVSRSNKDDWELLLGTPLVKSSIFAVQDYNKLNLMERGGPSYELVSIQVYGSNLKLCFAQSH